MIFLSTLLRLTFGKNKPRLDGHKYIYTRVWVCVCVCAPAGRKQSALMMITITNLTDARFDSNDWLTDQPIARSSQSARAGGTSNTLNWHYGSSCCPLLIAGTPRCRCCPPVLIIISCVSSSSNSNSSSTIPAPLDLSRSRRRMARGPGTEAHEMPVWCAVCLFA